MLKIIRFLLFSLLVAGVIISAIQKTSIQQILNNPDLFNHNEVIVEGRISNLQFRVSKAGNAYTTFSLLDEGYNSIKVFVWGHEKIQQQNIKDGDAVEVRGIFNKIKYVGKYKFFNEIEALDIKKK
ncbi:MAG: exodeoxyribonuclease VII large subunit [bacterium]|nr:exodeoxyribonuclease VII large subunit [bacterium]